MKKIILLAMVVMLTTSSYAQLSFGAQLGPNLGMGQQSNDNTVYAASAAVNDPKIGFMVGVLAEVGFWKLAFRPEFNFIQKGSKAGGYADGYSYGYGDNQSGEKFTLNYIEVPLNVIYNLKLRKAGTLFFGLGPAVAIGLSGTYKFTNVIDANGNLISGKLKVRFDGNKDANDNDAHFKKVDIGANILAGFKLKMGAFAKVGFTYGFQNISPYDGYKYNNMGVSLCVGYMIGKK